MPVFTRQQILRGIQEVLLDAMYINIEADDIKLGWTLADLGAFPSDFSYIQSELMKKFEIDISAGELFPTDDDMSPASIAKVAESGRFTDKGVEEIKRRFPFTEVANLSTAKFVNNFLQIYTVESLVRFIAGKCQVTESEKLSVEEGIEKKPQFEIFPT
jgi:hypothetical protein